eukprot:43964-Eustigmatos_ZCMA.PRE.1
MPGSSLIARASTSISSSPIPACDTSIESVSLDVYKRHTYTHTVAALFSVVCQPETPTASHLA